ncbi:MAG: DUF72 domain-containing protein [Deltaproteobacteria bacterium]|nr:DUF72 domain-containing protein [Deltaproteobacteria bacterium]
MKIYIGTSGFGYKEWKGIFYPEKIAPQGMLRFYSEHFNTVEINNTFYHRPTEALLTSWAGQVPDDFVFAFKAPQIITHLKRLRNVEEETGYLFRTLSLLDRKLGPVLFQFPKSFQADRPLLEAFLDLIPPDSSCAFDFRSPSWHGLEMLELLHQRRCCLCIEETDDNPAREITATGSWGYLRLRRSDYSRAGLDQWMEKIQSQKWEKAFVFFKHEEEALGPQRAIRFQELTDSSSKNPKRGRKSRSKT